jgi:monoamine oxidase
MSADLDVVIIGAGAAGIAAGRVLRAAGLSILLVEAADRIGGRAWTCERDGLPFDLGCGWLHSGDRNPWTTLAGEIGFGIDHTPPPWGRQAGDLGFPPDEQREARQAYAAWEERLRTAPPASDCAADALQPGQRWNGYIDALSGFVNGAELAQLSVRDYLAYADAETGVNWRIPRGYGALVAAAADSLPIRLSTPVTVLTLEAGRVRLETDAGAIDAAAAIVAVPTFVLSSGALRLPPQLADRSQAAADLPLGLADKVLLKLDRNDGFEADTHLLGRPGAAATGSYHLRPFGRPVIEAFLGGATARALEDEGQAAMVDFAISELAGLYGAGIRQRLQPIAQSAWGRSPFAGGSYSHALPSRSEARRRLAEPFEGRIFFAGEACSIHDFSTAHGAWETGVTAAEGILRRYGRQAKVTAGSR